MQEKTLVLQHLTQQTEQNIQASRVDVPAIPWQPYAEHKALYIQDVRQGQAEDTTFLRQQLEALLRV